MGLKKMNNCTPFTLGKKTFFNQMKKIYSRCGENKSLFEYHRNNQTSNGYYYHCKECANKQSKEYYWKNRRKCLQVDKEWRERQKS